MIYDKPVFRRLGDCYVAVEFGDDSDLSLSFRVIALLSMIEDLNLDGLIDLQPTNREIAVTYDRTRTTAAVIESALAELLDEPLLERLIPSRVIEMPMWYDDPWSRVTADRFDVPHNIGLVAEHNGCSVEELIERHSGAVFWNVSVGFAPGCNLHIPMQDIGLTAPAYRKPRTWTPSRAVGVLGTGTSSYPVQSPGGTQLIGRLPIEIFEPGSNNAALGDDGVLLRTGDRLKYRPIGALEYDEIRERARRGKYQYNIEEDLFDAASYLQSRDAVPTEGDSK